MQEKNLLLQLRFYSCNHGAQTSTIGKPIFGLHVAFEHSAKKNYC
jgi:hypothetical protein